MNYEHAQKAKDELLNNRAFSPAALNQIVLRLKILVGMALVLILLEDEIF